jgi:hypothetical protein
MPSQIFRERRDLGRQWDGFITVTSADRHTVVIAATYHQPPSLSPPSLSSFPPPPPPPPPTFAIALRNFSPNRPTDRPSGRCENIP